VLKKFADLCRDKLRNVDILSRYGGEEFVALLLEANIFLAVDIADRMRTSIAGSPIETDFGRIQLTVSIGVAQYQEDMGGLDDLILLADQALYKAKTSGRNRVCF
jgi:diguanylate cyclase (GGDEF)-like protein